MRRVVGCVCIACARARTMAHQHTGEALGFRDVQTLSWVQLALNLVGSVSTGMSEEREPGTGEECEQGLSEECEPGVSRRPLSAGSPAADCSAAPHTTRQSW